MRYLCLFFLSLSCTAFAGDCQQNGCGSITASEMADVVADWQTHPDCNGDQLLNVADFVCLINTVPNLGAPDLAAFANRDVIVGSALNVAVNASDPDGDSLILGVRPILKNTTLDNVTDTFHFSPDSSQVGDYELLVSASDGFLQDKERLIIRVREAVELQSSSPASGESDVALTRETILQFNAPLDPQTLSEQSVYATFAGESLAAQLHLSSDQKRITLFYDQPLPAGARVRVVVDGDVLQSESSGFVDGDGDGVAGGVGFFDFDTLSITSLPGTAVCGRVFASELIGTERGPVNQPLAGVTITVDGAESSLYTTTDENGNFRLEPAPVGRFFVHIDGRTSTSVVPPGANYPFVGKTWESRAGIETNVGDVYLPLIVADTLQPVSTEEPTTISFPAEVLTSNPELAGVSIVVPADALFADDGSRGGSVGIAPVDPQRLPGALPPGLNFPLVITVQTDGPSNFDTGVAACFPNLPRPETGRPLNPDAKSILWSFNHDSGRFEVVGTMTVSADGSLICTDPGVGIPAPGWHGENTIGEIRLPPDEDGCPGIGWSDAWRIAKQVAKCIANFFKIGPSIKAAIDIIDEVENIVETASDLKAKNDAGTLSAADLDSGLALLTSSKNVAVTGYEAFAEQAPTAKLVSAIQCATGLTGAVIETVCGEEDCRGWVTDLICNVAEPGAALAQTLADNAEELNQFVTQAPLTVVCASLDTVVAIANPFAPTEASLDPDPQLSAALQTLIDDSQSFLQNDADVLTVLDEALDAEAAMLQDLQPGVTRLLFSASGFQNNYYRLTSAGNVQRGQMDGFGRFRAFVAPNRTYTLEILNLENGVLAVTTGMGPSNGGTVDLNTLQLIDLGLDDLPAKRGSSDDPTFDFDSDLLPDIAEPVVGTDPLIADTDDDGIGDGTEILQGSNPLDGFLTQTGIIASVSTPGDATDVAVFDTFLAVAGGTEGVSLFNIFNALQPVVLAQVDTPGTALRVALNQNFMAVADGAAGLALISLADPSAASVTRTLSFTGDVVAVTEVGDLFLLGTDQGELSVIEPSSGTIINSVPLGGAIADVQVCGDMAYVLVDNTLVSVAFLNQLAGVQDTLALPTPANAHVRLSCGADIVYTVHGKGYNTVDISDPAALLLLGSGDTAAFGWQDLAVTGGGIGVAAVGPNANFGTDPANDIALYDVADPFQTDVPFAAFVTPGAANAVTIHNGLAYVADRDASLQVVNFLGFDTLGIAPSVTLDVKQGNLVEEGRLFIIRALAEDDVQVRSVDFFVDGALVFRDGAFPFEYRQRAPLLADVSRFTVQARVSDTGGNQTLSEPLTLDLVEDLTAPEIISVSPANDATLGSSDITAVLATFTEVLDPSSIDANSVQLFEAGSDGVFDTGDDVLIETVQRDFLSDGNVLRLLPDIELAAGLYRVRLMPLLTDLAGNGLSNAFSWEFTVQSEVTWIAANGNWFDGQNWSTGTVPQFNDLVRIDVSPDVTVSVQGGVNIRGIQVSGILRINAGTFTVQESSVLERVIISGGTLDLDAPSTINILELLSGGNFGSGALTVHSHLLFQGGILAGSSVTVPQVTLSGGELKTLSGVTLQVTQQALWSEGEINGILGSQLHITTGATLNIQNGNVYDIGGGGTTLLLEGTLRKSFGSTTSISATFDNQGVVIVDQGLTLEILALTADAGTSSSTFNIAEQAQLTFDGVGFPVYNLDAGTNFIGDGLVVLNGNFRVNDVVHLNRFRMTDGQILGSGALTANNFEWHGGSIANASLTVTTQLDLLSTNLKTLFAGHLINQGDASWQAGNLTLNNASQLSNEATGTFDIQGDFDINWSSGGQPTFNNSGTLRKSQGDTTSTLTVNLNHSDTLEVMAGSLDVGLSFDQTAGSTVVAEGATLIAPSFSITGGSFGGDGSVNGDIDCAATFVLGGSPGDLAVIGNVTFQSGATLMAEIGGTTAGSQYDQLMVTGQVTLAGTLVLDTSGFTTTAGQTFSLMTTTAGISGDFAIFNDNPPGGQIYQYSIQGMDYVMNVLSP